MKAGTYSFETVCVDVARMSVHRDGVPVSLEPKAMDVLLHLLAHRDRLVTKDELLDAVWKDTFVTPNVLTRAVAQLRKALGDDAQEARIIGTVAKRGYRFIAPVVETPVVEVPAGAPVHVVPVVAPTALPRRWPLVIAVAVIVGAGVLALWWRLGERRPSPTGSDVAATRFTTRQGYDSLPALSPDGRSVVYVSDRTGSLELYLTGITPGAPDVALTSNGGRNTQPEWSPDGRWIAFRSERHGGIWIVPAAGGAPQQIVDFGTAPSWSPDSEHLVFVSDGVATATPSVLWTTRRDGTERAPITLATPLAGAISMPSWSHNGRFIVFSVNTGSAFRDVCLTTVDGRTVRKLASRLTGRDIRWAPDDSALYFGGMTDQRLSRLLRLDMNPGTGEAAGTPQAILPIDGGTIDGLSLTREGQALFGIARTDANLWRLDLRNGTAGEPIRLTNDTVRTTYPRISPDGHIAFLQFIEGRQISTWILAPDGTSRTPLLSSGVTQGPQWSRDGRRIFTLLDGAPVWVDLDTRRVTPIAVQIDSPAGMQLMSDDTGLLNHRADTRRIMNVWLSPFGGGPPRQMTFDAEGASYAAHSPDGKWIGVQLTRGADTWLGVMRAEAGAPIVPLVTAPGQSWLYSWSPDSTRIAFAGERDDVWNIFDVDRATGVIRQLTHWTNREGFVRYPTWDPKGDSVVFERSTSTASLWTAKLW